jgi:hypothetical protein
MRVTLFCEDRGHEQFVAPLVRRLAREEGIRAQVTTGNAAGGHGRALTEFRGFQKAVQRELRERPDLLVLIIDANCQGWHPVEKEVKRAIAEGVFPHSVVGCPDPHIERWYFADPQGFHQVVGVSPPQEQDKCERDFYKKLLSATLTKANVEVLTGPEELAPDLAEKMDLYRAGKSQPSLGAFVKALRAALIARRAR